MPSSTRRWTNSSPTGPSGGRKQTCSMPELQHSCPRHRRRRRSVPAWRLGRMHVFVEPADGGLTGFIDWGDVQIGDPAWDLAVTACHFASPSEGILRVHRSGHTNLLPHLLEGYGTESSVSERFAVLGDFYLAYRQAWVATLGPGEGGVPNPSLTMLLRRLDDHEDRNASQEAATRPGPVGPGLPPLRRPQRGG